MENPYTLYILICGHGEYYTGITSNLEKRLRSHQLTDSLYVHNIKQWTKYRQPVHLAFEYTGLENLSIAMKVERYVKSWKTVYKDLLISGDSKRLSLLVKYHQKLSKAVMVRANTFEHSFQSQHPYIAHTQK